VATLEYTIRLSWWPPLTRAARRDPTRMWLVPLLLGACWSALRARLTR